MANIDEIIKIFYLDDVGAMNLWGKIIVGLLVLLVARLVVNLVHRLIKRKTKVGKYVDRAKYDTVVSVLSNIISVAVYFIAIIFILDSFGVNTNSLIATAGIGGVALGFGSQYLVKDIISGMVILMENQYKVGDFIKIDGLEGVVESVGLRLTRLRDFNGNEHIIQNGSITAVTNSSTASLRARAEIYLPKSFDYQDALGFIDEIIDEVKREYGEDIDDLYYLGVTSFTDFNMVLTVEGHVRNLHVWDVERRIKALAVKKLEGRGDLGEV